MTNAFGLIEKVLAAAKISREEIEVIAVGLGPGSYTGIRAAIAVAQGWQLARGVKLLGVSSAECLAAQAQAEKIFGRVNVVIDAQRNEFYLATWEISEAERKEIEPLKIVPAADIAAARRGNFRRPGGDALVSAGAHFVSARRHAGGTGVSPQRFHARRKTSADLSAGDQFCQTFGAANRGGPARFDALKSALRFGGFRF